MAPKLWFKLQICMAMLDNSSKTDDFKNKFMRQRRNTFHPRKFILGKPSAYISESNNTSFIHKIRQQLKTIKC